MPPEVSQYLPLGLFLCAGVAGFVVWRLFLGKAKLPPYAPFSPMPVPEVGKYFDLKEPAIAWEAARGWNLNERPARLDQPGSVDHLILTARLLQFCSAKGGSLSLVFNFLVAAITGVHFDASALPPGIAPPGHGLLTVLTPSGSTLLIASAPFARALDEAVLRAQNR